MPARYLTLCLAGIWLLIGNPGRLLAEPGTGSSTTKVSCRAAGNNKMVRRVYSVADLILPVDAPATPAPAPVAPVAQSSFVPPAIPPAPALSRTTCAAGQPAGKTLEDRLIKLIVREVAPSSWEERGGLGKIEYYPVGMALVIHQTPEVQEQIAELLEALRRLQDVDVAVEVRLVTVPEPIFGLLFDKYQLVERVGVDFECDRMLIESATSPQPCPRAGVIRVQPPAAVCAPMGFLNDAQLCQFMEAMQGDRRSNIMCAPKLTVANGQSATMSVTDEQLYVTGLNFVQDGGQAVFVPKNEPYTTGVRLTVQPAVSQDRRFVQIKLHGDVTTLATSPVPLFPVTTFVRPQFEGGAVGEPVPFTQFLQQPKLNSSVLATTVAIPDGGTVILGGSKAVRQERCESGPPVLSKIPYVNRLFKNVGYGQETEHLLVLVTPRIIIQAEEEPIQSHVVGLGEGSGAATKPAFTCPYLQAKDAEKVPPVAAPAAPTTVTDNLEKLKQAQRIYEKAEHYRVTGHANVAVKCYEKIHRLCPGSHYDQLACERLADLSAVQDFHPTATVTAEEEQVSPQPKGECACCKQKQVAELLGQYEQACAEGRLADATQVAVKALAIDPACFSKKRPGMTRVLAEPCDPEQSCDLPQDLVEVLSNLAEDILEVGADWAAIWYGDEPQPEPFHGN